MTVEDLRALQAERHRSDIASGDTELPSPSRLKRRALEMAALAGQVAGGGKAPTPDMIDRILSCSAGGANLFRIDLSTAMTSGLAGNPTLACLLDAAGRLSDSAEKIDHLEEFAGIGKSAVADLARWAIAARHASDQ